MHPLQHITDLAEILFRHGIEDVVISPGSRNAPLIRAFYNRFYEKCKSIVDERSAAYFALGKSLVSGKPTVLISTSGTAVLNFAPAVAEAFFQGVPLLVITADRPPGWIGQQDNQAIWQNHVYGKNARGFYSLPLECRKNEDLWFAHRNINEAFVKTVSGIPGPVHINVPMREPLYSELPPVSENLQVIQNENPGIVLNENRGLHEKWKVAKSIMFVCGQNSPNPVLQSEILRITNDKRVVVVAEPTSNLHTVATISSPETVLNSKINYPENALPELVVYFGGQMISKKIKVFLRALKGTTFYFVSPGDKIIDTFQNVNYIVKAEPASVLKSLKTKDSAENSDFQHFWKQENLYAGNIKEQYIQNLAFSDLAAFKLISEKLPDDAMVFAGNSSVVRYLSYFNQKKRCYFSNRGTSGIDGSLSAAAGVASKTTETVFAIVGDLSFVYDSNALWNRDLPKNLKIILINNRGGGIFHLLKGPSESVAFTPFFNAYHPVDLKKLTEAFGLDYHFCKNQAEIENSIQQLYPTKTKAEVLEIGTPNNGEPQITKDFFKFLNNNYGTQLDND